MKFRIKAMFAAAALEAVVSTTHATDIVSV